jgi:hypothetical protein
VASSSVNSSDFLLDVDATVKSNVSSATATISRAPRLGEIEQFSTETQTDLSAVANVVTDWGTVDDDDICASSVDEFGLRQIEAETQFDLDDILCSNYTQTGTVVCVSTFFRRR